ncbi:2-C-methyl-D-erythritol 2,4-cyclodiphosphate synthase [Vampirovibrio chlorellavorus]|uniref:2-C-methyl-D-erythritol 2,4-cyclodiphosphate synthase n=1 Tax=Vampirovibrio chlorellavorus TaxID=758823 RepID=UPI0026EFBAEB|nr:2-C-methyl-D-erythritol 2,4-cyclodiphosphate synthase [Vampirovibrio chlorellavorus]
MGTVLPFKIGQGYDLHRLVAGQKLMIGGIQVESPVGCEAHSDGDVVLHALIDALLGACALGDIGDHFPPSDDQYKGMDSSAFVAKTLPLVTATGYRPGNVDVTIFLEKPKLGPYKADIREKLAELLDLAVDCVSVKAKTAEKFPPVGTQEAIAASVTALLYLST